MSLLVLSVLVLLIGPLLARFFQHSRPFNELLDGFVLVSIGGIAVLHLLPEAFMQIGIMAIVMAILGALLPAFAEKLFHQQERITHTGVLTLALSGILLHTLLDGMALSAGSRGHGHGELLAYAVVLHRLPVGMLIWWALRPLYSIRVIVTVLLVMCASTIGGYLLGGIHVDLEHSVLPTYFQALVTGSLLHVLFHRHFHDHGRHGDEQIMPRPRGRQIWATIGAALGLGVLLGLPVGEHLPAEHSIHYTLETARHLFLQSAPALLLGFTIAASIQLFLPATRFGWLKRGGRSSQVTRGMLFGLPLPICSCGVVPLYHTLTRKGVPLGAAMAFLIATPELGIDAVLISVPLLGWQMALIRVIGAAIVAWVSAWLVDRFMPPVKTVPPRIELDMVKDKPVQTRLQRFWHTLNHDLIDELGAWILLGLIIAAIADPFLGKVNWADIPPWLDVPLLAIIGMPLYVCAVGATPIAAVMLLNGISPGAVLAFLLTGPATNVSTIGVIRNLNGNRAAILFPVIVIGMTVTVGIIINLVTGGVLTVPPAEVAHHDAGWHELVSAGILLVLFAGSLLRIGPRGLLSNIHEGLGEVPEDAHEDHNHE